jgi:isocitrate dehydrogenase
MMIDTLPTPSKGKPITSHNGQLNVPPDPIIPFIEGDGIGPDIWKAARPVLDAAVTSAYKGKCQLCWLEVLAGGKALTQTGSLLPDETIQAFEQYKVGIKGPLTTPVGGGHRSLNVALRRQLDLYACLRPVRWMPGVPTPVCHPEKVDMVIFRENTEDLYAGVEFEAGTADSRQFQAWLRATMPDEFAKIRFPETSGFSIKPISREGSQRLVRAALNYALKYNRKSVTLVHKGNIMKHTEGAFAEWGYSLAESEFGDRVYTRRQYQAAIKAQGESAANAEREAALAADKLWVNDVITDAAFEQTLTRPEEFDVIATMNLNGDYLSDALTAQVGGLGIAPGANLNFESGIALFEATHGTAPSLAGKNVANPCSLILSGTLMLRHLGWDTAAKLAEQAIAATIAAGTVTFDFQRLMPEAHLVSTTEFGQAVTQQMQKIRIP